MGRDIHTNKILHSLTNHFIGFYSCFDSSQRFWLLFFPFFLFFLSISSFDVHFMNRRSLHFFLINNFHSFHFAQNLWDWLQSNCKSLLLIFKGRLRVLSFCLNSLTLGVLLIFGDFLKLEIINWFLFLEEQIFAHYVILVNLVPSSFLLITLHLFMFLWRCFSFSVSPWQSGIRLVLFSNLYLLAILVICNWVHLCFCCRNK